MIEAPTHSYEQAPKKPTLSYRELGNILFDINFERIEEVNRYVGEYSHNATRDLFNKFANNIEDAENDPLIQEQYKQLLKIVLINERNKQLKARQKEKGAYGVLSTDGYRTIADKVEKTRNELRSALGQLGDENEAQRVDLTLKILNMPNLSKMRGDAEAVCRKKYNIPASSEVDDQPLGQALQDQLFTSPSVNSVIKILYGDMPGLDSEVQIELPDTPNFLENLNRFINDFDIERLSPSIFRCNAHRDEQNIIKSVINPGQQTNVDRSEEYLLQNLAVTEQKPYNGGGLCKIEFVVLEDGTECIYKPIAVNHYWRIILVETIFIKAYLPHTLSAGFLNSIIFH